MGLLCVLFTHSQEQLEEEEKPPITIHFRISDCIIDHKSIFCHELS